MHYLDWWAKSRQSAGCSDCSVPPRILLAIGFFAGDGTKTANTPITEKIRLLKLCCDSVRASGSAVIPVIIATGKPHALTLHDIPISGVDGNPGLQQGDCVIGWRAIELADRFNCPWIVKVGGDCFHPNRDWARRLVSLGEVNKAALVATVHHYGRRVNTQVFAVETAFMKVTWPRPQDPRLTAKDSDLELVWGANIDARGLSKFWYAPPSTPKLTDGIQYCSPNSADIAYLHAHKLTSAEGWKVEGLTPSVKTAPSLSIVVTARNETERDRNGKNLLAGTIESILNTSRLVGAPDPEIIGIDDGSTKKLDWGPEGAVKVIRNSVSLGVDPSRAIGIAAATRDVIATLDGHMKGETQAWIEHPETAIPGVFQKLAIDAVELRGIINARCAHMELMKAKDDYPGCGANFAKIDDGNPAGLPCCGWQHTDPPTGIVRRNGLLGAGYFALRDVWARVQSFSMTFHGWGKSEEFVALKAAFLNVPIYCDCDAIISHWFRSTGPFPYPLNPGWEKLNAARMCSIIFEPAVFESFWMPHLKHPDSKGSVYWTRETDAAIATDAVQQEGLRFRAAKLRTDREVMKELLGVEP